MSSVAMISSNKYNLGLLRKTSAYSSKRNNISETSADNPNRTDFRKPIPLEDLKDVHTVRLSDDKFKIFIFGFVPWVLFMIWYMY